MGNRGNMGNMGNTIYLNFKNLSKNFEKQIPLTLIPLYHYTLVPSIPSKQYNNLTI